MILKVITFVLSNFIICILETMSLEEQELIKELLDVIEQRNEVVQFMDEQRKLFVPPMFYTK